MPGLSCGARRGEYLSASVYKTPVGAAVSDGAEGMGGADGDPGLSGASGPADAADRDRVYSRGTRRASGRGALWDMGRPGRLSARLRDGVRTHFFAFEEVRQAFFVPDLRGGEGMRLEMADRQYAGGAGGVYPVLYSRNAEGHAYLYRRDYGDACAEVPSDLHLCTDPVHCLIHADGLRHEPGRLEAYAAGVRDHRCNRDHGYCV